MTGRATSNRVRGSQGIPSRTIVECWPGARPGRSYQAMTITGLRRLGDVWGYYVRGDEGTDFIAATHVRVVL